jgi:hypothetical protein
MNQSITIESRKSQLPGNISFSPNRGVHLQKLWILTRWNERTRSPSGPPLRVSHQTRDVARTCTDPGVAVQCIRSFVRHTPHDVIVPHACNHASVPCPSSSFHAASCRPVCRATAVGRLHGAGSTSQAATSTVITSSCSPCATVSVASSQMMHFDTVVSAIVSVVPRPHMGNRLLTIVHGYRSCTIMFHCLLVLILDRELNADGC